MFNLFGSKNNDESADSLFEKGWEALKNESYSQARDFLQRSVKQNPNNARAWNALGVSYAYLEQNAKALEAYLKAVELDTSNEAVFYENAIYEAGAVDNWELVRDLFHKVVSKGIKTESAAVLNLGGLAFYYSGEFEKAKTLYELAIQFKPDEQVYKNNMNLCLSAMGENEPTAAPQTVMFASGSSYPDDFIDKAWERDHIILRQAFGNGRWYISALSAVYHQQRWAIRKEFPEDVIKKGWDEGFDIIDLAYGGGQWSLLLMKESGYTDQIWRTRKNFPQTEIQEGWDKGLHVSHLTYGNGIWALVMSKADNSGEQRWFTRSKFPKDDI